MSKEPNNLQIMQEPKSAHLYERRSGNNWYKKKTGEKTDLEIYGEVIKQFPRERGYPYLGHFINLNSTWEEHVMICSLLESKICNIRLPLQKLKYYEDLIVNRMRI